MRMTWRIVVVCVALGLAGCSSLPPRGPLAPSSAYTDTQGTTLAKVAAASLGASTATPTTAAANSGFRLLPSGEQAFDARLVLAERAERSIDAQYYHVHADSAGAAFLLALRDAANRGVRVRLLVDDYHAGELYPLLRGLAAHSNAEVRLFNPLLVRYGTPIKRMLLSLREFARVNHRMHNKLFVADNAVAVYGGRNIADEYFARHGSANFVDLDVISTGAVVRDLSASFDRYWNSAQVWTIEQMLHSWDRNVAGEDARRDFDRRAKALLAPGLNVPELDPLRQSAIRQQLAEGRLSQHVCRATVHDDPPEKVGSPVVPNEASAAMRGKLDVIASAREQVQIVSPYFLPGEVGMKMMRDAARRGTRALIVTNSLGSTDEPLVHRGYSRYRAEMLALGMQLYEFGPDLARRSGRFGSFGESTPRLHAKVAGVDGRWLLVGSVNMDARSAILNTELGVVIDCPALTHQAQQLLQADAFASMYQLKLGADGKSIQWHSKAADGSTQVQHDEPHASALQNVVLWLQSLFISEESL